jgi:peptidoglycan-associated lipoprotein
MAAPTAQITATPALVSAGDQVQLSWRTTMPPGLHRWHRRRAHLGREDRDSLESTTYHLVARGDGGTAEATARVTVNAPPPSWCPTAP